MKHSRRKYAQECLTSNRRKEGRKAKYVFVYCDWDLSEILCNRRRSVMFTFLFPREIFAVTIYLNRWKAGYHLNLPYTDFSFPSLPDCDENVVIVRTCRYYEGPYAVMTITPRKHS